MVVGDGHDALGIDMSDPVALFLHDVPPDVVAESEHHVMPQSSRIFEDIWPLDAWPDVPTYVLLCAEDRLFPPEFQRRVIRERLDVAPDEMVSGHLPALAHPAELADRLLAYGERAPR